MKWPFLLSLKLSGSEAYYFCDSSYFLIKKKVPNHPEEKEHKHPECQVHSDDFENVSSICLGRLQNIPSGYLLLGPLMGCGISPESSKGSIVRVVMLFYVGCCSGSCSDVFLCQRLIGLFHL